MDLYRKRQARLVVSPSPWSVNTVLLVTVFVVTTGLVYHWGHVAGWHPQSESVVTDVESLRREWKRQTEQTHADAVAAADEARLQWRLAVAERQEFLDRFLQEQEQELRPATPTPALSPAPPVPPASVENPEWSRLNQRLAWLEQRHAELLTERTVEHPEVQELTYEVGEVQRALQGVPQRIRSEGEAALPVSEPSEQYVASLPSFTPEPTPQAEQVARQHAEARRQMDRLGLCVEEAHDRYEQLAAAERVVWADHVRGPDLDPVPSLPVHAASVDTVTENSLSTALLAGMAMMVGVGIFAAGAGMEPGLNSIEQISSSLGAPVVATVTLPGLRPAVPGRYRSWLRLVSCLGGAILMVGCLGLVYQSIMG